MKKLISLILTVTMVFSLVVSSVYADDKSKGASASGEGWNARSEVEEGGALEKAFKLVDIKTKKVPVYYDSEKDKGELTLAFFDEDGAVPYISVSDVPDLAAKAYQVKYGDKDYKLTISNDGDTIALTRENGCWMKMDFSKNTISFIDLDVFLQSATMAALFDQAHSYGVTIPMVNELFEHMDNSYQRFGKSLTLPLSDYGIDLVKNGKNYYIPLAIINDFILSPIYTLTVYNGNCVIMAKDGLLQREDNLLDVYFDAPTGDISPSMSRFNYNELCLSLDYHYGLQDIHGITSFDELFIETGLKTRLLSEDPNIVDNAISEFICQHLDDVHSAPVYQSYYSGKDFNMERNFGNDIMRKEKLSDHFKEVRTKYFPDGAPGYEEVGDTAYITFDEFTQIPRDADYYKNPPTKADTSDTVGLMLYSYAQITREGSPVKNVVMDLSCNTGGESSAAAFVIATFLGEGTYSIKDDITGALMTENYRIDLNLDHKFDEKDSLAGYKLYCLESPASFSCGNLVPSVYKNSGKITLLGQTSAGGSCIVLMAATAHGLIYNVSGPYRLAFTKNGSFYDIDRGVEPDIFIDNPENYYDRQALTEYIHGLY